MRLPFLLLACALAACGKAAPPAHPDSLAETATELGRAANPADAPADGPKEVANKRYDRSATSIAAPAGSSFTLDLRASKPAGYGWHLSKELDPKLLAVLHDTYDHDEMPEGAVGGGGFQMITFIAVAAGSGTLELEYCDFWRGGTAPHKVADRLSIPVSVH